MDIEDFDDEIEKYPIDSVLKSDLDKLCDENEGDKKLAEKLYKFMKRNNEGEKEWSDDEIIRIWDKMFLK